MNLSVKLGLASALSVSAVLIDMGYNRVEREAALFETDMRRDHQTFGRALALAAQAVALEQGVESGKAVIAATNRMEPRASIEFVNTPQPPEDSQPIPPWTLLGTSPLPDLVSHVPAGFVAHGYIRIEESRQGLREYLRGSVARIGRSILSLLTLSMLLTFGFGWLLLSRPLRMLVGKLRRVGEGDLEQPLVLKSNDEMSVLALEINAMCERLKDALRRVQEEGDARVRAIEQLRHADRLSTVGELASGLAHELGTPLSVIAARAKMIATGESQGGEIREDAQSIQTQADRMGRIIRQLLDYARSSTAKRQLEDVRALVQVCVDVLGPLAARFGVRCTVLPGEPAFAWVDAAQMQQVVTNLVVNAIHARPRSGEVRISVTESAERLVIQVEDDGEGMTREVLARIFEPFFTTKDVGKGTGLGLPVAHGIVEEHGGTFQAESVPGEGTTIRVLLPIGAPP